MTLLKRIIILGILFACFSAWDESSGSTSKSNEVIGKEDIITEEDPPVVEIKFYINGKQIAKRRWSTDEKLVGAVIDEEGQVPDGLVKVYNTGILVRELHFRNHKLNGISKHYYEDGTLAGETNHKDDQLDGMSKWYRRNGETQGEATFQKNKLVSTRSYLANGMVRKTVYNKNQTCYEDYDTSGVVVEKDCF